MKQSWIILISFATAVVAFADFRRTQGMPTNLSLESAARVRNQFEFDVRASFKIVAPLFGPEGERLWAGDEWDPKFLYPTPARDVQGAVFTVSKKHGTSIWINTLFDLERGRMQYVYFIPDVLVTLIDVRLTPSAGDRTYVNVIYERTALDPKANDHVVRMGKEDGAAGPEWKKAIEAYLEKGRSVRQ
jgi:hypothetical protein